ncbi:HAD-IIIC family phosphatase (plasmid) [Microbulbifer sp. MKSA007]|nr:HAD-IIIC family phosphatase [Microbulbifer sp. MKSA007]
MKIHYWKHYVEELRSALHAQDQSKVAQACRILGESELPLLALMNISNNLESNSPLPTYSVTLVTSIRTGFLQQLLRLHLAGNGLHLNLTFKDPAEVVTEGLKKELIVYLLDQWSEERRQIADFLQADIVIALNEQVCGTSSIQDKANINHLVTIANNQLYDQRTSGLGILHLTRKASEAIATQISKIVRAKQGLSRKLIICDLDGLLWPGTLGESGPSDVKGDPEHFGPFHALQSQLKELKSTGQVQLAIASKNNFDDIVDAFRKNSDMPLKLSDFSQISASWNPKPERVEQLLVKLNTGATHSVFLDDNPVERAAMRATFPQLVIPECAGDPTELLCCLKKNDWTWSGLETSEDKLRAQSLAAQDMLRSETNTLLNLENLDMHVRVLSDEEIPLSRVVQLFRRVTQFNSGRTILNETEIKSVYSQPNHQLLGFELTDSFARHGVVALSHCRISEEGYEILEFLMSCRALGRGLETFALQEMSLRAQKANCRSLIGYICETSRNEPMRDVYARHHFKCVQNVNGESKWKRDFGDAMQWPETYFLRQE